MFKRHLHWLGLLAVAYGAIITYTALSRLETTLILMMGCGLLVKRFALTKKQWGLSAILLLVMGVMAWFYEVTCEHKWLDIQQYENQMLVVTGTVCAENPFKTDRTELLIESVLLGGREPTLQKQPISWLKGRKVLIQIAKPFLSTKETKQAQLSKAFANRGGQRLQVALKPSVPLAAGNPGFFDYRLYLALKDIWCTAYVSETDLYWQEGLAVLPALRESLIVEIKNRLDRVHVYESLGPSLGMLLGFDDFMSEASVADYFMAGTVHVLTVSGFHFALVYAVLSGIMKQLPVPYNLRVGLSVAFVLFFLLLTGIKFAPYRAGMSMLFMLSAPYFARRFDLATVASAIILPELVLNPYKAADMSLILCYLACLAITHGAWATKKILKIEQLPHRLQKVAMPVVFLVVVQLTLWLPVVCSNNTINLMSIPSNLLGTLLSGHMLLMNTLLVILNLKSQWWCTVFSYVNGVGFILMDLINQLYKGWKGSVHYLGDPKDVLLVLYLMGLLLVVLSANTRTIKQLGRVKIVMLVVAVVVTVQGCVWYNHQSLEVYFFDVGQGDGLMIRTPKGHFIAFDCGPEKFDFQQAILNTGGTRLSKLYLTHGHKDHTGGLQSVKEKVEIQQVLMGDASTFEIESKPSLEKIRFLEDGEIDWIDGLRIKAYRAPSTSDDANETGVLYLISYGRSDVFVTGDAGTNQQIYALKKIKEEGKTLEVLKLAHHGSPKSTSVELAQSMKVGLVVVSVGKNRYGHPSENLLNVFRNKGIQVLRTDERGCILLKTNGQKIKVQTFKKTKWALKSSTH